MATNKIAERLQKASFNLRQKQAATLNIAMPRKNIDSAGRAGFMTLPAPPVSIGSDVNSSLFDVDQGSGAEVPPDDHEDDE